MFSRLAGAAVTTMLVVAALGLACWFAFSAVSGAALITFRTGSMSPTMPQGALAVSLPVSASEIEVGDVITVQRAGEALPVTHRVIEVGKVRDRAANEADIRAAAPGGPPPDLTKPGAREIVMQGDDNDAPDHLPYAITDARKVVFSLPFFGTILMMMQTPIATGALIVSVGVLVVWAFWPKASRTEDEHGAEDAAPHHPRHTSSKHSVGVR